jgi:hypothetical protein
MGGMHWGGIAHDPEHGLLIPPVNRVAAVVQLLPRRDLRLSQAASGLGDDGAARNAVRDLAKNSALAERIAVQSAAFRNAH